MAFLVTLLVVAAKTHASTLESPLFPPGAAGGMVVNALAPDDEPAAAAATPHPATRSATMRGTSGGIDLPYAEVPAGGSLTASIHRFLLSAASAQELAGERWNGLLDAYEIGVTMDASRCETDTCADRGEWKPFYRSLSMAAQVQLLRQERHGVGASLTALSVRPSPFLDHLVRFALQGDRTGIRAISREIRTLLTVRRSWETLGGGGIALALCANGGARVAASAYQTLGGKMAVLGEVDTLGNGADGRPRADVRAGVRVLMGVRYTLDLFLRDLTRARENTSLAGLLENHLYVGVGYGSVRD